MHTRGGKYGIFANYFRFATTVDLNKCFKQIKLQFLLFTCAPISELLSNLSTVCPGSSDPPYSNLLYKMGHYFLDTQYIQSISRKIKILHIISGFFFLSFQTLSEVESLIGRQPLREITLNSPTFYCLNFGFPCTDNDLRQFR